MVTFCEGLRGFTPWRSARRCVVNFPKPVNATSPPPRSDSVIASRKASTALAASRLERPDLLATSLTNSCLVKSRSSCRRFRPRAKTLTVGSDPLNHAVLRGFSPPPEPRSHGKSGRDEPPGGRAPQPRPPRGRRRRPPFRRRDRPLAGPPPPRAGPRRT